MVRPPAPSVPPPGWDELLPKEEQSLLWQQNSKEDQETWHQQVENYVQAPGEQEGDIIWEQPEGATTWQEDLGDGWSGGYGPLTVQAGMVVGASDENGFKQFLEVRSHFMISDRVFLDHICPFLWLQDEIAGLRPEE